jgi:hypothetical protein
MEMRKGRKKVEEVKEKSKITGKTSPEKRVWGLEFFKNHRLSTNC